MIVEINYFLDTLQERYTFINTRIDLKLEQFSLLLTLNYKLYYSKL